MNFKVQLPQNAGNRISEVLDFKISRGRIPPDPPLQVRGLVHQSTKPLDPPLISSQMFFQFQIIKYMSKLQKNCRGK
jgi:hypothetical protein